MPGAHSSAGLLFSAIECPRCPDCRNRMMLARITPGPEGFDVRTFECAKCHHVLAANAAHDRGRRVLPSIQPDDYVSKRADNSDSLSV
jgi:hypothetical protein